MHGHDLMMTALAYQAGFEAGRASRKSERVAVSEFIDYASKALQWGAKNAKADRPAA